MEVRDNLCMQVLDWKRIALVTSYGGILLAPVGHYWYMALDRALGSKFNPSTIKFVAAKVHLSLRQQCLPIKTTRSCLQECFHCRFLWTTWSSLRSTLHCSLA